MKGAAEESAQKRIRTPTPARLCRFSLVPPGRNPLPGSSPTVAREDIAPADHAAAYCKQALSP